MNYISHHHMTLAEKPGSPSDLLHYGVKGMKWGVRRTPEQLGRARTSRSKGSAKTGAMSPEDIQTAYGAAAAALIVAQSGRNFIESGNARVMINKGKRAVGLKGPLEYKKDPSLAKKMSEDQLMKKVVDPINPDYPGFGTKMNCRRATVVYEMRRRGMDVEATKTTNARGQHGTGMRKAVNADLNRFSWGEKGVYKDTSTWGEKIDRDKAPNSTFAALKKEPNGSRGEVAIAWLMGGGHSVSYEIVNNKPVIFDNQRKTKIKTASDWNKAFNIDVGNVALTRLDNKPLNEDWLERWAKNRD